MNTRLQQMSQITGGLRGSIIVDLEPSFNNADLELITTLSTTSCPLMNDNNIREQMTQAHLECAQQHQHCLFIIDFQEGRCDTFKNCFKNK